jgi:hypothetical protein
MMIGIGVVAAAAIGFFALSGGSKKPATTQQPSTPASTPAATPAPTPASSPLQLQSAKQGKTPKEPAPALTQATLQELSSLLDKVTTLRNESVTARAGSSDNQTARAKMSEAYDLLQQWQQKVDAPLRWQESAQMEDWAQPAEYVTLEKLYAKFQRLNNEVRRGGGG